MSNAIRKTKPDHNRARERKGWTLGNPESIALNAESEKQGENSDIQPGCNKDNVKALPKCAPVAPFTPFVPGCKVQHG